jgi:hypothetical protein
MPLMLKKVWIDIVFLFLFGAVILAGGRGFSHYFSLLMALGLAYFLLKVVIYVMRKKSDLKGR